MARPPELQPMLLQEVLSPRGCGGSSSSQDHSGSEDAPDSPRRGSAWTGQSRPRRYSAAAALAALACLALLAVCRPRGGGRDAVASPADEAVRPLVLIETPALRKAQGLCVEMPGVQLGAVDGETPEEVSVASADDCVEHCRKQVHCGQAVASGPGSCRLFKEAAPLVLSLGSQFHSAYCGMLTVLRDMKSRQDKLLSGMKARKSQGVCVDVAGVRLAVDDGDALKGPPGLKASHTCFEECRRNPSCQQATFAESSKTCSLSSVATSKVVAVGEALKSTYCGTLSEAAHFKERRKAALGEVVMRKAQGICLDLDGVLLAGGREAAGARTAAECSESCRSTPRCSQATFSEDDGVCYHGSEARRAAMTGKGYRSSYCGLPQEAVGMSHLRKRVQDDLLARKSQGICVEVESIALRGDAGGELADLPALKSAKDCFQRCRVVPDCGQVAFAKGSGRCRLYKGTAVAVDRIGGAYRSAYCGSVTEEHHLKNLRTEVQQVVQMRRAMGVCEEMPGLQMANGAGGSYRVAFPEGVNASAAECVEACRREPGCAQAVFSRGNSGCYVFKEAATRPLQASSWFHSAFCGKVTAAKRMEASKSDMLQQVQMRKATGICSEVAGVQIADGSGFHEAIFSNDTRTAAQCVEMCRKRVGCEQVVFSKGNKGCYVFEKASSIKALHQNDIFHSAYCGDLQQAHIAEARVAEVKKQVEERKSDGLCFEAPGVRAADGTSGTLAEFEGNVTQKKCVERCRTSVGCEQVVFYASAKPPSCHVFETASDDIFHGLWDSGNYRSAFCGTRDDWEMHKAQQVQVMKLAAARQKAGACIDLPGVQLVRPEGRNFYTWADNASQCVEHCRTAPFCGQIAYTNHTCQLFQNLTVGFSALGKAFYSARCSDWKDFSGLKAMQNKTLELMKAPPA